MAQSNTSSPQLGTSGGGQQPMLSMITHDIILNTSTLDSETKARYIHYLDEVQAKLDPEDPFGSDDSWAVVNEWMALSQQFYTQAGVEGKVIGTWTEEERLSFLMDVVCLEGRGKGKREEIDLEEYLDELWRTTIGE